MQDVTRHPSVRWIGALQVEETDAGLRPSRIPPVDGYQMAITTKASAWVSSGIRVVFRSNTTRVRVAGQPFRIGWPGFDPPPGVIDLDVDGSRVDRQLSDGGTVIIFKSIDLTDYDLADRGPDTIEFDGLGAMMKDIAVWLPNNASFTVADLRIDDEAVIEPIDARPVWIHHGSSISQCSEAEGPTETWPVVAARHSDIDIVNLGFGGECHVDQFMARYIRDADANLISLKFGINSYTTLTERTLPSAVHGFLDTVRDGHPDTPIVLCSPIYCPLAETNVGPLAHDGTRFIVPTEPPPIPVPGLLTLEQTRLILEGIVGLRRSRGDENLHYLSGLDLFGADDVADLPDELHPNTAGYGRMGERFATRVFGEFGLVSERTTS